MTRSPDPPSEPSREARLMTTDVGRVAELWRYPVKSLGGERVSEVTCDHRGLVADRRWAVVGRDGKIGSGKTTRRFRRMPGLLAMSAALDGDGVAWVQLPSGERARAGDPDAEELIASVVGEPVSLEEEVGVPHFDDAPLHIVSTRSLTWLRRSRPDDQISAARFRPNVVVEVTTPAGPDDRSGGAGPEDEWVGHTLRIGAVDVGISGRTGRCVMVTMRQPGLGFAPAVLGEITRRAGGMFGVYGRVLEGGCIRVGDRVSLVR
jgi:uncharacterized protein